MKKYIVCLMLLCFHLGAQITNPLETELEKFNSLKNFGYDVLKENKSKPLPVDAVQDDYIVRPGDEIVVDIWGNLNLHYVLPVNSKGNITIPNIGRLYLNGTSFAQTKKKIAKALASAYSSINADSPGTGDAMLDISLGKIPTVKIFVTGYVGKVGVVALPATSTSIINVLTAAHGIDKVGSLRNITIKKSDGKTINCDLFNIILNGSMNAELKYLSDGDVIQVPLKEREVFITGAVRLPGVYELKNNENFNELLHLAGGFAPNADKSQVQIFRISQTDRIKVFDVKLKKNTKVLLQDQDKIFVREIKKKRFGNMVSIKGGGIRQPGTFEYHEGMTLSELIKQAGGLYPDALKNRIDILRMKKDLTTKLIHVDYQKLKKNNKNTKLMPMDQIMTYSIYIEKGGEKFVKISGNVRSPGSYLLAENMSLSDLLFMAGGFDDPEFKKTIYFDRGDIFRLDPVTQKRKQIPFNVNKVLDGDKSATPQLLPGDEIKIYNIETFNPQKYVQIFGEVNKPGKYVLKNNMNLKDLIVEAGGLTANAYPDRVEINRIDDSQGGTKRFLLNTSEIQLNTQLQANDFITIPKKPKTMPAFCTVGGKVQYPGKYTLDGNDTLVSIIKRAGGLKKDAFPEGTTLTRNKKRVCIDLVNALKNPNDKSINIAVKPDDSISVPMHSGTIEITGAVQLPSLIPYIEGETADYYIELAGGFLDEDADNIIRILTPAGYMLKVDLGFFGTNPAVPEGSKIIVKPNHKSSFNPTKILN